MKKKTKIIGLILGVILLIILGGCNMTNSQTTREDQIAYLKQHEKEITNFIKSQNSKVESVQVDWNSVQTGTVGNGLPQGGGEVLTFSGKFNKISDSSWTIMMSVQDGKVDIKRMGLEQPLRILKNGGWDIYE